MRALPPLAAAVFALCALPLSILPLSVAAAQDTAPSEEHTSIGGYGEVHYHNLTGPNTPGSVNVARFVLFLAHSFNDKLSFRSELEVEDARIEGGEPGGEVALEQLYLDYAFSSSATLRAGLVLPPIGIVNETHEPPTF